MPLIWKEVCRPNVPTVYIDAATGQPRTAVFTTDYIKYLHDSGKEMLKDELSIPVPLEHQPGAEPKTKAQLSAERLLNNTGFVNDYAIAKDGRFFTRLNIEDEKVYRKLPRTIKYVSPMIQPSFTDGNGKTWQGVITHMALTSRPRITKQAPFGNVAAALALAQAHEKVTLVPSSLKAPLTFSLPGALAGGGADLHPLFPAAFSVLTGAAFAEGYDAPEGRPPKKKEGTEKKPPEGSKKEGNAPPFGEEEEEEEHEPIRDMIGVASEMLSALYGVDIEPHDDPEEFASCIVKALMQRLREEKGNDMTQQTLTPPPPNPAPTPKPPVVESAPVYMSLEEIGKIDDPRLKMTALAAFSLQQTNEKLTRHFFAEKGKERDLRVEKAVKGLPKESADFLKAEYDKVKACQGAGFSMGDDGEVKDAFEPMLKFAEGLPRLPSVLLNQLGARFAYDEAPQPQDAEDRHGQGAVMSKEKAREVADELCKKGGIPVGPEK